MIHILPRLSVCDKAVQINTLAIDISSRVFQSTANRKDEPRVGRTSAYIFVVY